jgi:N-acetylglucosaminyldiphosphoundecaprenol N-acetyl-beta-D-mannosaminyltransferase
MAAPPLTPPTSQKSLTGSSSATVGRHGEGAGTDGSALAAVASADGSDAAPPRSGPGQLDTGLELIDLLGMSLARCSEPELLDALFAALEKQRGGWLITANLDFLRRYYKDPRMQVLYSQADLRVADGMPLVWAAYLQGTPLPERMGHRS